MRRSLAPALAALVLALAGCATLPDTKVDRQLGEKTAHQVEESIGLVDDAALGRYVSAIGARVAAALPTRQFEYKFAIVDQVEPNAFAAPGGFIYISRGLLALCRTEDEIAGVIAHEIMHVEKRHSVQQMQKQARLGLLALPGVLVTGIVSTELANLVAKPFEAVAARYSRDQEREADTLGQPLAAAAGYDPMALVTILARMERFIEAVTKEKATASFFDSHPSTPERVASLTQRAKGLAPAARPGIAGGDAAFVRRLDGLLFGENAAEGVVEGSQVLHPDLDLHLAFPKDWKVDNSRASIAAMAPRQDAIAAFGVAGKGEAKDLRPIAEKFAAKLEQQYRTKARFLEEKTAHGLPAQAVYVTDSSGKEPTHLYFLWVADRGTVYQMIGITPDSQRALVRSIVDSLRPLTAAERASIRELRVRVVPAQAGESLAAVAGRSANVLPLPILAAVNGVDAAKRFEQGEGAKVIVRVPYRARP